MGFFGRLFAKKPGGTRVGNFLRQFASNNTYGLLGQNFGKEYGEILRNNVDNRNHDVTSILK